MHQFLNSDNYNSHHIQFLILHLILPLNLLMFLTMIICLLMLNHPFLTSLLRYLPTFPFLNLMINTPTPLSNTNTNLSNSPENSFINLCTLNIRGLNDTMKQTQLLNYAESQHYDIIGLTETHFTTYNNTHTFKDHPSYHAIWTIDESHSHSGT